MVGDGVDARPDAKNAPRVVMEATKVSRHFDVSRPWLARTLAGEGRLTLRAVD